MRNIVLTLFLCLILQFVKGQEFSFPIYFEDAVGNKDTITLGYDPAAIGIVDQESNIINEPYTKELDVRIGYILSWCGTENFMSKKRILPKNCQGKYISSQQLYILCKNYPLTVSWDASFEDDCNSKTFITDWHDKAWYKDVQGGEQGPFLLKNQNSITFTHLNIWGGEQQYFPFTDQNLNLLFFAFAGSEMFIPTGINAIESNSIRLYPNPVKDQLHIEGNIETIEYIHITDIKGKSCLFSKEYPVEVSHLSEGVYIVEIKIKNNPQPVRKKIMKGKSL